MKKIIVVEDNDMLRENICEILALDGYDTVEAANGKEGWELAINHKPDLVLSDMNMPEMDGMELLKKIRDSEALKTTPFIFLTVRNTMQELRMGMNYGADDYLAKPFEIDHLLDSVKIRLDRTHAADTEDKKEAQVLTKHEMALEEYIYRPLEKLDALGKDIASSGFLNSEMTLTSGNALSETSKKLESNFRKILLSMKLDTWEASQQAPAEIQQQSPFNMQELLTELCSKSEYIDKKHFYFDIEERPVLCQKQWLGSALGELLENALLYSKPLHKVSVNGKVVANHYELEIVNHRRNSGQESLQEISQYMMRAEADENHGPGLGLSNATRILSWLKCEIQFDESKADLVGIKLKVPLANQ